MITPEKIQHQQYCPRRRFLAHEYKGAGLEPVKPTPANAVDDALRVGLRALLEDPSNVTGAVTKAEMKYSALTAGGLELKPNEDAAYVAEEQAALVAAIVRSYSYVAMNPFDDQLLSPPALPRLNLGSGIQIDARPDAMIFKGESATAIFWRFVAGRNDVDSYAERHRIVPAVINAEHAYSMPVTAQIQYIVKGQRRDGQQYSPLIRGYKCGQKYNWHFSAGWEVLHTWKWPGVAEWLRQLPRKAIEEQFRVVKQEEDFSLIDMLSPHGREEWIDQVYGQEGRVADDFKLSDRKDNPVDWLEFSFPQYRHSCRFCPFTQVCDQRIAQPEDTGLYRLKNDN